MDKSKKIYYLLVYIFSDKNHLQKQLIRNLFGGTKNVNKRGEMKILTQIHNNLLLEKFNIQKHNFFLNNIFMKQFTKKLQINTLFIL